MSVQLATAWDHASRVNPALLAPAKRPEAQRGWDGAMSANVLASRFALDCEIYGEGEKADVFYKVVAGVVRTCRFLSDGSRQIDAFHVAGDVFGIGDAPCYHMSAEAVTDCRLLTYRRCDLEGLVANDKTLSAELFAHAIRGMEQAQDHASLLGRRCAVEKVVAFLRQWARRAPLEPTIVLAMSRRDVADYLGLTIESVSRAFSQLQRDAVIELTSSRQVRFVSKPQCAT